MRAACSCRSRHLTGALVAGLRRSRVGYRSLHEALDTTTPGGRLIFHVFAALAEFLRELIVEGTREGLVAARGQRLGRPPAMTGEQTCPAGRSDGREHCPADRTARLR